MTLVEEAREQFTEKNRTAVNVGGKNVVWVREVSEAGHTMYALSWGTELAAGYTGGYLDLEEVKNHFVGLAFASNMNPNAWVLSPQNG